MFENCEKLFDKIAGVCDKSLGGHNNPDGNFKIYNSTTTEEKSENVKNETILENKEAGDGYNMTELEKTLFLIREECNKHKACRYCPLLKDESGGISCALRYRPDKWTLRYDIYKHLDEEGRLFY